MVPHGPGQGFMHFWLIQAKFDGHSALTTHSGRHPGGEPVNSGRQEQTAWSLITWHLLFGPQGDGEHGSFLSSIIKRIGLMKILNIKLKK